MDRKITPFLLGRIILLAALTLSACTTPTPPTAVVPSITPPQGTLVPATTVPTDTPILQTTPQSTQPVAEDSNFGLVCESNKEIDFNQPLETTPYYINRQVILTGPADRFPAMLDDLAAEGIKLTPVIRCTLNIPQQLPNPNADSQYSGKFPQPSVGDQGLPFMGTDPTQPEVEGNRLAMNLYQFDGDPKDTFTAIQTGLDKSENGVESQSKIYADLNYLTERRGGSTCGSPFSVEGSPFSVEGSPFSVEGSTYGGMGLDAKPSGFWKQWAFEHTGLVQPGANDGMNGDGVQVGVFDTSPYPVSVGDRSSVFTNTHITPELGLIVHYPIELLTLQATIPVTANISDHGLFVSSLVHAFAYKSEIHLYRVLDDAGCGDLFHLNAAMLKFLSADWNIKSLTQPAVVNLSLGVRKPLESRPGQPGTQSAKIKIENMDAAIREALNIASADPSIESLGTVTQLLYQAGIVIVAAAGNDSVVVNPPLANMPLLANLPAGFDFVTGVSASTKADGSACYSNSGDVFAPGGDGIVDKSTPAAPTCLPKASDCPNLDTRTPGACEFGVMGLSTISPSSYAYWVGTSFATPIVSGIAALVYQQTGFPGETVRRIEQNHLINVLDALQR